MDGHTDRRAKAREKLDRAGIDEILDMLSSEGMSLTGIAQEVGVSVGSLLTWIDAEPERSARVREARAAMAKVWDERAEDCILRADDEFTLRRARELAQHYRWRATKIAPREYGDKVDVTASVTLESLVSASMGKPAEGGE
jgi:transposase